MTNSNPGGANSFLEKFRNRTVLNLLRVLFLLSVFILVWRVFDGEEAIRLLFDANPLLLLAGFISLNLQTVLAAFRWRLTASQLGLAISAKTALGEYYLSQIANQSLPGGVLGDAGRVVRSSRQAGWVISAKAVFIEKMTGQVMLFVLFFITLSLGLISPTNFSFPSWLLNTSLLVLAITILLILLVAGFISVKKSKLASMLSDFSGDVYKSLLAKNVRWPQLGLTLGGSIFNIFGFIFAAWAIGAEITVGIAFILVPIILLAMLIPLTIGGWGIREATAATLFPIAGASQSEGLASSVAFGLLFLLVSLPGVLVALSRGQTPPNSNDQGVVR